ncbi:hypothetical protein JCM3765_003759 [Sporobolomyces pararoseus]
MTLSRTAYEDRARAPSGSPATRTTRPSSSHSTWEESLLKNGLSGRLTSNGSRLQSRTMRSGPGFEPITLTAYETGKRYPRNRRASYSASDTGESSSDEGSSSSGDDSSKTTTRSVRGQQGDGQGELHSRIYLVFGLVAIFLLGAGFYLLRNQSTTSASNSSTSVVANASPASGIAVAHSSVSASSQTSASSKLSTGTESADTQSSNPTSTLDKSASSDSDFTPSPTTTAQNSDSSRSSDKGAPPEYSGITLSGTFVDTASYSVATGKAATVSDDKANADMSKIDVQPNEDLAKDREDKIWVGDGESLSATFYAAGKGGYGSCGTKLYDGQDIYFAAMSVYDLMGSASPSPFCYSCISLQSTKDPSKTITAIVSDSCPACTLAHVDLEQKAFFALGATVDMGVLTVAWSFVECPVEWSKEALEQISESVYEEVKS